MFLRCDRVLWQEEQQSNTHCTARLERAYCSRRLVIHHYIKVVLLFIGNKQIKREIVFKKRSSSSVSTPSVSQSVVCWGTSGGHVGARDISTDQRVRLGTFCLKCRCPFSTDWCTELAQTQMTEKHDTDTTLGWLSLHIPSSGRCSGNNRSSSHQHSQIYCEL